jgi:hypothetical protein
MDCDQKIFKLVWRCHHLLSGFISRGHLPWVSRQSRLSANDGDNEMVPRPVHRSPEICLTDEENPPEILSKETNEEDIASNGVPSLQMRSIASHSTSGRKKDGKQGKDGVGYQLLESRLWNSYSRVNTILSKIYIC